MPDGFDISGLEETQTMLRAFAKDLAIDGMEGALIAGSSVLQEELAERAPRREGEAENREFAPLADSLITDVAVNTSGGTALTGFGDSGPVALWNEYGHRIVTHSKKDTGKETEPNPFMRRTVDACGDRVIDAFGDSLGRSIGGKYGS